MTVYSGIGMNYGHQVSGTSYDTTQVESDFSFLRAAGIARVRIAFPPYNDTSGVLTNCQDMVTRALSHGFYVVFGVTTAGLGATINATTWTAFKSYVTGTLAPWAQTHGLSELVLGNEEEFRADGTTITVAQMQTDIRTMASTVKSGGYSGVVSYSTYIGQESNWKSGGLGSLDLIGFNLYDYLSNFAFYVQTHMTDFGSKSYVSEFGCITNGFGDYTTEDGWTVDVVNRIAVLLAKGVPYGYFFTYRDGSFGLTANTFALVETGGSVRKARQAVLSAASAATAFNQF